MRGVIVVVVLASLASAVATAQNEASLRAGMFFTYEYDGVGNRTKSTSRSGSGGAREYSYNKLNQMTSRRTPGVVHVSGYAPANATVLVSDRPCIRDEEHFFAVVEVDNSSGPVVAVVTIAVIQETADETTVAETSFKAIVAKQNETSTDIVYDGRGNLLANSVYEYTWDLKNRLTAIETGSGITDDDDVKVKLEFEYDPYDRRTKKLVYSWDSIGEAWQLDETTKFVWDGWLLVAELDANDEFIRSYIWGLDKSGSMQGAGGIGGLLGIEDHVSGKTYWVASDHNGNVMNLVDAADQTVAAAYEYSPFGEQITVDGAFAAANPMRFSSKYYDAEVGLYYYGYRYYTPADGRWLNRDPIAEDGGLNLYAFVHNKPKDLVDPTGKEELPEVVLEARPGGRFAVQLPPPADTRRIFFYSREDMRRQGATDYYVKSRTSWPESVWGVGYDWNNVLARLDISPENASQLFQTTTFAGQEFPVVVVVNKQHGDVWYGVAELAKTYEDVTKTVTGYWGFQGEVIPLTETYTETVYTGQKLMGFSFHRRESDWKHDLSGSQRLAAVDQIVKTWGTLRFLQGLRVAASQLGANSPPRFQVPAQARAFDPFLGAGGEAGFGRLVGWGVGARGAAARTTSITKAEIQRMGMNREVAQYWLNFYRNAVDGGRGAATAPERIKLMERILELVD